MLPITAAVPWDSTSAKTKIPEPIPAFSPSLPIPCMQAYFSGKRSTTKREGMNGTYNCPSSQCLDWRYGYCHHKKVAQSYRPLLPEGKIQNSLFCRLAPFFFFFLIGTTSHHRSYECRIFILPAFHTTRTSVYVLIITTGIRGESPIGGSWEKLLSLKKEMP